MGLRQTDQESSREPSNVMYSRGLVNVCGLTEDNREVEIKEMTVKRRSRWSRHKADSAYNYATVSTRMSNPDAAHNCTTLRLTGEDGETKARGRTWSLELGCVQTQGGHQTLRIQAPALGTYRDVTCRRLFGLLALVIVLHTVVLLLAVFILVPRLSSLQTLRSYTQRQADDAFAEAPTPLHASTVVTQSHSSSSLSFCPLYHVA